MKRLVALLALALTAAAIGITAAPAGAEQVGPPPGLNCHNIDGDREWAACEVSEYLGGPFAPPPHLRPDAWMVCRPFGDSLLEFWDRDLFWGCGWSKVGGYDLVWRLK